ncbi:MAG: hypothetical protein ACLUT2_03200 [Clostridium sp.]
MCLTATTKRQNHVMEQLQITCVLPARRSGNDGGTSVTLGDRAEASLDRCGSDRCRLGKAMSAGNGIYAEMPA